MSRLVEQVVLVDEQDREVGLADKLLAHQYGWLHRAFSVFIVRTVPTIELLLQQRAFSKYHSPGLWTNTCCSHPQAGETILLAGQRRLKEECYLTVPLQHMGSFHYHVQCNNGLFENEMDHVLLGIVTAPVLPTLNPMEAHAYRWISLDQLKVELSQFPEKFTPWFKPAWQLIEAGLKNVEV